MKNIIIILVLLYFINEIQNKKVIFHQYETENCNGTKTLANVEANICTKAYNEESEYFSFECIGDNNKNDLKIKYQCSDKDCLNNCLELLVLNNACWKIDNATDSYHFMKCE
jgi:hypothetical protein